MLPSFLQRAKKTKVHIKKARVHIKKAQVHIKHAESNLDTKKPNLHIKAALRRFRTDIQNTEAAGQATANAANDHTTDDDIVDDLLVAAIAIEHSNGVSLRCMEHSNCGGSNSSRDRLADKQPVHERFGPGCAEELAKSGGDILDLANFACENG